MELVDCRSLVSNVEESPLLRLVWVYSMIDSTVDSGGNSLLQVAAGGVTPLRCDRIAGVRGDIDVD